MKTRRQILWASSAVAGVALFCVKPARSAEVAVVIPPPLDDLPAAAAPSSETAVFAGGCFWGVQGVFQHVQGVRNAVSGYAGGDAKSANYDTVSRGQSQHAEAVRITYDPKQISYGQLLQIFFSVAHNPTELNRQGPDDGPQYRSTIFPGSAEQARVAKNYIAQLDKTKVFGAKIATTTEAMKTFYPAERYHQDFLTRNPTHPYIVVNDLPKIDNLKRVFPDRFRAQPVLVGSSASA